MKTIIFALNFCAMALPILKQEAATTSHVSKRSMALHRPAMLIDGHNDLPWQMRTKADLDLNRYNISKPLN